MLSQIEACSLPLLYKLSVALPAGNQTYPKKDKTNLRIDCGFLLVVISNEVLIEDMHCRIHSNEHVIFSYVMTVNGMRIDSLHGR